MRLPLCYWCPYSFNSLRHSDAYMQLTNIGSDGGLSPDRRQAIILIKAKIMFIGPLGTNSIGLSIEWNSNIFIQENSKMSSGKWRPFCLDLNVLKMSWAHNSKLVVATIFLLNDFESENAIRQQICTCFGGSTVETFEKLWSDYFVRFIVGTTRTFKRFELWAHEAF